MALLIMNLACLNVVMGFSQAEDPVEPPVVEVWLNAKIEKMQGFIWPRRGDCTPPDIAGIDNPTRITVHFPSGRAFRTWSKSVFLDQRDGIVRYVSVVPLAKRVPFPQALTEVKRLAQELKIDGDPKVRDALTRWQQNPPAEDFANTQSTGANPEKGIHARFEIKYDTNEKGWFVLLQFSVLKLFDLPEGDG